MDWKLMRLRTGVTAMIQQMKIPNGDFSRERESRAGQGPDRTTWDHFILKGEVVKDPPLRRWIDYWMRFGFSVDIGLVLQ